MTQVSKFSIFVILAVFFNSPLFGQNKANETSVWVTMPDRLSASIGTTGLLFETHTELKNVVEEFNVYSVKKALPDARTNALQNVYEFSCNCDPEILAMRLNKMRNLEEAVVSPRYEILSTITPNDYALEFPFDYALDLIGAQDAWSYSTGDTLTIIGITDAGYYENHEDLLGEYTSLINATSTQYYYHGTAVAVAAAGGTNNGLGKSAIGYDCKLALNTIGYNQLLALSYGGAKVINVSWTSGCVANPYVQGVIDEVNANGTIVVASAGNGSTCNDPNAFVYPAACDGVIAVSSVGPNDNHERTIGDPSTTHQHNSKVDLCAPGYDVALTVGLGNYMTGNGSSFAAPYVSGTIGLMLSLRPCLSYDDVLSILKQTAVNIDAQNPMYIGLLGAGRLDAGSALEYVSNLSCVNLQDSIDTIFAGNPTTIGGGIGTMSPNDTSIIIGTGNMSIKGSITSLSSVSNSLASSTQGNIHALDKIEVYPNPTKGLFSIKYAEGANKSVQIVDATGRNVGVYHLNPTQNKAKLELAGEPGIYFLYFYENEQIVYLTRVVKE